MQWDSPSSHFVFSPELHAKGEDFHPVLYHSEINSRQLIGRLTYTIFAITVSGFDSTILKQKLSNACTQSMCVGVRTHRFIR